MTKPPRLLFLGLDTVDTDLIDQFCAAGRLPTLARLRADGLCLQPGGISDTLHASAWTTLFTGVLPDVHGQPHAYVNAPGQQTSHRPNVARLKPEPFWRQLDTAGLNCITVDPFMSGPLDSFSGVQLIDWGSWTRFHKTDIRPTRVETEIRQRFGRHRAPDHSKVGMEPLRDPLGFAAGLVAGIEQRGEMLPWLLRNEAWDFALAMFGEAHAAGHYLWPFRDPASPMQAGDQGGALEKVYVALDAALARVLEATDEQTSVWLCSCDGLRQNHSASHLLPSLLDAAGLSGAPSGPNKPVRRSPLRRLRELVPSSARAFVSRKLLPRRLNEKLAMHWRNEGKDWSKIKVSVVENANEGLLRVNLAGREPEGIVEPGRAYEELCQNLVDWISAWVHPETKQPIARKVLRTDEYFHGPRRAVLADVIAVWNYDAKVGDTVDSPHFGRLQAPGWAHELAPFYSGNHFPKPWFVATGPQQPEAGVITDILDIAPAILRHFGVG